VIVERFAQTLGGEMRDIPWEKILTAIKLRDAARLRFLAEETRCDQRRALLQVFAGIVENGTPIGESNPESLPRMAAHLGRDSWQRPFPASGSRKQECTCRMALYRADGYSIELALEHERGSRRLDVIGQIGLHRRPRCKPGEMAVLLMSGKNLVARAVSDALGGFRMQCLPERRLRLCVPLQPRGHEIEVPLGALISRYLLHCGKAESSTQPARAS
jgi:hypothetical protein